MTLRILGAPRSRTFRALWVAHELGLDHENIPVAFTASAKDPALLAANPNGRIPAIDDDGFVLFESFAITLYLAKKHAPGSLYPAGLEDEARCWQWTLWGANEIERPLIDYVYNTAMLPVEQRDAKLAADAYAKLPRPLAVLDAHLARHAHLLGGGFTVADLNVASLLYTAWFNKVDLSTWPHVRAWLDGILTRPAAVTARKLREQ